MMHLKLCYLTLYHICMLDVILDIIINQVDFMLYTKWYFLVLLIVNDGCKKFGRCDSVDKVGDSIMSGRILGDLKADSYTV